MGNIVTTNANTNISSNSQSNISSEPSLNINSVPTSNPSNSNIQEAFSDNWHFYKEYDL